MSSIIVATYILYFFASLASPLQRRWIAVKRAPDGIGQVHFAFRVSLIVSLASLALPLIVPATFSGSLFSLAVLTLITGVMGAGYAIASFVAQRHVEAGLTTLISTLCTPITIVLATFFLRESLTVSQIYGTILLLVGVAIVAWRHRTGGISFNRYFLLMVVSALAMGVALTTERALQIQTGFSAATILSWWSQCICLGIAALFVRRKTEYTIRDALTTGSLRTLLGLAWVSLVFSVANLSIVSAVTTFKVVVMFIAAAIFLDEREDMSRKIIGSVIALAGLLLME